MANAIGLSGINGITSLTFSGNTLSGNTSSGAIQNYEAPNAVLAFGYFWGGHYKSEFSLMVPNGSAISTNEITFRLLNDTIRVQSTDGYVWHYELSWVIVIIA